ncbi:hypothetical protein RF11_13232 [Thelohanellus kitauei]|uniref:Uncharacterized protein n=1 Tax=Thelohanellus kitauei TaxID=669202 RepID=A0A0C2MJU2_THEKT|nr:hypothetical protein RF11_13232 [Thelohanellus kitauei]
MIDNQEESGLIDPETSMQIISLINNNKQYLDPINVKIFEKIYSIYLDKIKKEKLKEVEDRAKIILNFIFKKVNPHYDFNTRKRFITQYLIDLFNLTTTANEPNVIIRLSSMSII